MQNNVLGCIGIYIKRVEFRIKKNFEEIICDPIGSYW